MLSDLINGTDIRKVIEDAISEIHANGPVNQNTLQKLSYIKKYNPEIFSEYENTLLSVMGLFYKLDKPNSFISSVYSNIGLSIQDQFGKPFTPMQASVYKAILTKKYYSFSAPTSTGKSHLFRELIQDIDKDIVIVVPSRALIAEFFSIVLNLVSKEVLVLQFVENVNQHNAERRIFIITPERGIELFKYVNEFEIGLFLFDEAQISEEPIRGISFDAFVRRTEKVFPNAKKVFAHPFVANPEAQILKHNLKFNSDSKSFKQNNVGKIFAFKEDDGSFKYFSPYQKTKTVEVGYDIIARTLETGGSVLIYVSKSKIFRGGHIEDFGNYIEMCTKLTNKKALKIINDLKSYIGASNNQLGKTSMFLTLMAKGIVVHHGSMPLKARLMIEQFVRLGFARICFATSTLNQGINMPFDCVWIDHFSNMNELTLKNLIGRAGRTSNKKDHFDYGYTVINKENLRTFKSRVSEEYTLVEESKLDQDKNDIPEDLSDLVDAIKTDTFNDELHLTNSQVERLVNSNLNSNIKYLLDNLIDGTRTITANQYYEIGNSKRAQIKAKLKSVYISHLKRSSLTKAEQSVLSASIPLLLWRVQGKSFSETLSLRHSYLTKRDDRRALLRQLKEEKITQTKFNHELDKLKITYSVQPSSLPNHKLKQIPLFPGTRSVKDFDYDRLIYDTYDYIDKVISLSLADPLCAALTIYYQDTEDDRAKVFKNYIRYGTNNETEIWLMKYGFDAEDTNWIAENIVHIDEMGIIFKDDLSHLTVDQITQIYRYLP
ncbi:DEAD/DEAH box helicase [Shewanella chilikensis]|uniref:DEAD/DEAH box helicase n=1 Tax=Shewanella chilikensis TaxID=558541 RepID=UPI0030074233